MTSSSPRAVSQYRVKPRRFRLSSAVGTGVYHVISAGFAALFLAPLVLSLVNSFKSSAEASQVPPTWFPKSLSFSNYTNLAGYGEGVWVYTRNSLVLCALVVALTVGICVLAGYGFARYRFAGRGVLFGVTLLILMVPYATILVPLYIVLGWLGLQNTVLGVGLVLVMFNLPFGIFMLRNSFESIPRELEEAALVDGASTSAALRYVALPLAAPGMITVALFAFIGTWNEFLVPLVFLNQGDQYTLSVMLLNLRTGAYSTGAALVDYGAMQAGVVVSVVPVLVVYLLLQRYFVSGLMSGALRG
jgi:multiple sugar transport system permease protein